ncbi:Putative WD40 repeat protein [Cavenderia fasciculata]|uniref:WD40 repeat protein n=1 Tax=Cavenderia fasciculata TaxID=261658 RepID=F4PZG1_CACFS|nr:Putative WD40 repeat protein [Cavenderia fasciculata]EGG19190.1 Putative WD40 repeat protein [Cavenderia fasciculata]|eukprot:XP_004366823.1 Putative WD40 repeat protein [Cavenderia fasciculata]
MPNNNESGQLSSIDARDTSMSSRGTGHVCDLSNYHFLKNLRVQYDWQQYKGVDTDCFWLSFQKDFKHTTNDSIRTTKESNNNNNNNDSSLFKFESEHGFKLNVENDDPNHIKASCENYAVDIYAPNRILKLGNRRIISMGVSPDGDLGVYGATDGILEIFETSDGQVRRKLEGHVGDVDVATFFPSGKVILSGASDARLKIWDAIEGNCAATLLGHHAGITCADFVDRGRNIVSTSRDGTSRLWDVPSQSCIAVLSQYDRPINGCYVTSATLSDHTPSTKEKDSREYGTDGKSVITANEEGFMVALDLRSHEQIAKISVPAHKSAFNSCTVLKDSIFGGDHDGHIFQFDRRKLDEVLSIFQFTKSPIHHLKHSMIPDSPNKLWASSGDGCVYLLDIDSQTICKSLSGIDTDVVTSVNIINNQAFTSTRDSFVRCYQF